jgi:hypothetical protein
MNTYKIRQFDKTNGQILVEFESLPIVAIDLPVVDGKYPEGSELDSIIQGFFPSWIIERKQILSQGVSNEAYIESLVEPLPVGFPSTDSLNYFEEQQAQQLENDKAFITDIVNQILASKGL